MSPSEPTERRIRYDETFKAEAIRLWKTTRRPARLVAKELGISPATLYSWGRECRPAAEMVPSHLIKEIEEELCRLREERGELRQQCAILKKMLSIFFELPDGKSRDDSRRLRAAH